jgi:hypothetical protein
MDGGNGYHWELAEGRVLIIIFQQFVNEDKRAFQPKEEVLN